MIKYGIGLDKWINIPFLSKNDFLFTFEYVGTKIQDYQKKAIINPWYEPWDKDEDGNWDPTYVSEYNNTFILVSRGNYLNGKPNPQCVVMYEVEPKAPGADPVGQLCLQQIQLQPFLFHDRGQGRRGPGHARQIR